MIKGSKIFILSCVIKIFFSPEKCLTQEPLDLREALRLAKQNNLQLKKQEQSQVLTQLEEAVQKAQRLPSLDFTVTSSYLSEINVIDITEAVPNVPVRRVELGGHDRTELLLGVRQPIFTGFRLASQVALAETSTLREQTKIDILSNEIYYQVYLLFYKAQSLYTQRRILETSPSHCQCQQI